MNENKTTILIGNGFNYSVKNFISNRELQFEIDSIIALWQKFEDLITDNEQFIEEILENLHKSFTLLSLIRPFENDENLSTCIKNLKSNFNENFIEKLWEIVFEFIKQERNGFYGRLTSFLYNNGFENLSLCEHIQSKNISIYTTNYDGIAEIIFGYNGENIVLPDGFRGKCCYGSKEKYVCFCESGFYEDIDKAKLFHLHGSYKFFLYNLNEEIKVNSIFLKEFVNNNKFLLEPVIILNAKNLKYKQIKNYNVLTSYLYAFELDLNKSNTLVIWGQSLNNDPHIERLIKNKFFRSSIYRRKLVIIDKDPNHRLLNTSEVETQFINPEQENFIDILKRIIND